MIMTPTGTSTLSCSPSEKRGFAAGIYNTIRFSGATLGVAILSSVVSHTQQEGYDDYMKTRTEISSVQKKEMAKIYFGLSYEESSHITPKMLEDLNIHHKKVWVRSMNAMNGIMLALAFVGLSLTLLYLRAYNKKEDRGLSEVGT